MTARIGFIGAGKMAEALISGLLAKKVYGSYDIVACAPSEATRKHMSETYGIRMYQNASEMMPETALLVLAVKPKQVKDVFKSAAPKNGSVLISVVAGLSIGNLKSYVPRTKVVRVMPNHCVAVLEGAMGYTTDGTLSAEEKADVVSVLKAVGLAVEVTEDKMDAITGLAGSSPAFLYMVIDAMADAGVLNGIPREDAIMLAAQSMLGSAKMILKTGKHPCVLKDEVCSPSGTTIEGVLAAEERGLRAAMTAAIEASVKKSHDMSK